jgi:hypothetical protein
MATRRSGRLDGKEPTLYNEEKIIQEVSEPHIWFEQACLLSIA